MTSRDDGDEPPFSPALEALVAEERVVHSQPEILRARSFARARAAMREAPLGQTTSVPAASAPPSFFGALFAPVFRVRSLSVAAALALMVAGAAAALHFLRTPQENQGTAVVVPAAPAVSPSPAPVAPLAPERQEHEEHEDKALAFPHAKTSARKSAEVQEELQLLSRARELQGKGDHAAALAVLTRHERDYPAGRLAEEREALRVKALLGLDRRAEARQMAERFHHRFPRSVLRETIDSLLALP